MSKTSPHPRIARFLVTVGVIAACASAHAAASASPFGAESVGSFEPARPLAGSGWQPLASVSKSQSAVSSAPSKTDSIPSAPLSAAPIPSDPKSDIVSAVVATPVAIASSTPATPTTWSVTQADGTFRQVIEAWAPRAGWTLSPWELDNDIPVDGSDVFEGEFKGAVRHLLASTELTDYALQPCFYSNKRVRVVKATTKCDPSQ
jgi:hypothetical protein